MMTKKNNTLTTLRDMMPIRPLSHIESLRVAELQAMKLLALSGVEDAPVPDTIITDLPRIQVERIIPSPVSGAAQWSKGRWLILLNGAEPKVRQRFSLIHEFKHVLDNPFVNVLYPSAGAMSEHARAEQVCDYFSGCVLMPRPCLKKAWTSGTQDPVRLAQQFDVSRAAMRVRLLQIGLADQPGRCRVAA